jgi:hypothetical protein
LLHTIRIDLFAIDTLVINVGDRPHFSSFPEQLNTIIIGYDIGERPLSARMTDFQETELFVGKTVILASLNQRK